MQIAQEMGILNQGDLVVQTAGTLTGISGSTDLIKVGLVRKIVSRGISIGEIGVTGKARIIKNNLDISLICPGEILFVPEELMENIPLSKNIAGIVTNQNVNDVYSLFNKNNKKISDFHIRAGSPLAYRQTGEIVKVQEVMGDIHDKVEYPKQRKNTKEN